MKFIVMVLCIVALVYSQFDYRNMNSPKDFDSWEKQQHTETIGVRDRIIPLGHNNFFIIGYLYGKRFIGIQVDNGEPEQTNVHDRNIRPVQLERFVYVAYISESNLNKLLMGNTSVSVTRLYCSNLMAGKREEPQKLVFVCPNDGYKYFEPQTDCAEIFYVYTTAL